ncbi:MAG: cysteine synthase A [Coprococcus sp.]
MGNIYHGIIELIGHTPLVELHRFEKLEGACAHILAKLEAFNPAGSVKDRPALNMIETAEADGTLKPGGTILEGTSGNTGIGLAAIGAAKGYKVKVCMPDNVSIERRLLMQSYGAEVILTPGEEGMGGANARVAELHEQIENSVIIGQGANPDNPGAHYKTTGPEIWEDTDGKVDILVAASGTGGTICGTGKFLKEKNPDIQIIAVEPLGSPALNGGEHGPHKIQGIGGGSIPPVTDTSLFNEVIDVSDDDAYLYANKLPQEEGISIGISAGAALWAATQVAKRPENEGKNVVVIIPDSGDHYLSSDLYDYKK